MKIAEIGNTGQWTMACVLYIQSTQHCAVCASKQFCDIFNFSRGKQHFQFKYTIILILCFISLYLTFDITAALGSPVVPDV